MGIQDIKGVGPATVKKLNKAGIRTLDDLRGMDVEQVAKKTGVDKARLAEWKTEAKLLKVLDDIKGIGPSTKKKLQDAWIHSVDDLARAAVHELAHATNIAQDRLKAWQKEALKFAGQAEAYVKKEAQAVVQKTRPARTAAAAQGKRAAEAAKVHGVAAAKKGKSAVEAAAKRSSELAHEVAERMGSASDVTPQAPDASGPSPMNGATNGNGNGHGFLGRLKRIFVRPN